MQLEFNSKNIVLEVESNILKLGIRTWSWLYSGYVKILFCGSVIPIYSCILDNFTETFMLAYCNLYEETSE